MFLCNVSLKIVHVPLYLDVYGEQDASMPGFPILTGFLKALRGGSQSILAQANDGQLYVVKFANNLQGKNLLFNEAAGSMLYSFADCMFQNGALSK